MALSVEQMVDKVRRRVGRLKGIKTALDYMGGLSACLDAGHCRDWMASMGDPQRWENAIKSAAGTMVYDDDETVIDGGIYHPDADEVREFGQKRIVKDHTPGSIMDVEAVYTATTKDRMGDVLEAAGAKVDPAMPTLFMHIPFEPIGRHVRVLKQNTKRVEGHFALMDRPLAVDAARMVEFKAVRISHGFRPIDFEVLEKDADDDDWRIGFHVKTYEMMEVSLVTVPAHVEAIILLHSRDKFVHPLTKQIGAQLRSQMPDVVRGGWEILPCACGRNGDADLTKEYGGGEAVEAPTDEKPYPNEHSCRLVDPGKFKKDSFRRTKRKHEGKEYSVIMAKLKDGGDAMKEQAYRYPKSVWTAAEAKSHCTSHDGSTFEPASESSTAPTQKDGDKPKRTKISKRNLTKLGEAKEHVAKVIEGDAVSKSDRTLLSAALANLDDVIADGTNAPDDEEPKNAPAAAKATPSQMAAGVIAAIDAGQNVPAPLLEMLTERLGVVREKNEEAAISAMVN
jgi:hypothetical protein